MNPTPDYTVLNCLTLTLVLGLGVAWPLYRLWQMGNPPEEGPDHEANHLP